MNGFRTVRKYIERCSDKDLHGLWEASKDDIEYEAVVITHLIECEMEERKERYMTEIMKALRALEVNGYVTIKQMEFGRFAVYVDSDYFGIWDTERKTFVD